MDLGLKGKKAIVTGGSRGIGRAIAETLAEEGVDLAICARGAEGLEVAAKDLVGRGVRVFTRALDVADGEALKAFIDDAAGQLRGLDILVCIPSAMMGGGERLQPEPALLPSDPFAAGKVMELVCHLKLDIDLVARRCLPELLFGKPVSEETKEQVKADLEKGIKAVSRLFVCDPYAMGAEFTIADLYTHYMFAVASAVATRVVNVDLLGDRPRIAELLERLAGRPSIARVTAEMAA